MNFPTDPHPDQDGEGAGEEAVPEGAEPGTGARHDARGRRAAARPPAPLPGIPPGPRPGRLGPHGLRAPGGGGGLGAAALSPCDPSHLGGPCGLCKVTILSSFLEGIKISFVFASNTD